MAIARAFLIIPAALLAAAQPQRPVQTVDGVRITPIRHASLMLEANGKVVHVDPWSQGNYEALPAADLILITDTHGDHLDLKAIERVKKPGTQIVATAEAAKKLTDAIVMANGDTKTVQGFAIEAIPMYNEKRGPAEGKVYHEKGRGNGYVVTLAGKRVYIAGDTEGIAEMRALKNIDIAFIPMNLPNTMPPEEAADAVKAFRPKVAFPYHYRASDTKSFAKALEGTGVDVRLVDWYY